MKILFYTGTHFADCSFPLIKAFEELGHDVTTIMQLTPDRCHKTIIDINNQPSSVDIIPAADFLELKTYESYLNLNNVFFANHPMSFKNYKSLFMAIKVRNFISKGKYDVVFFDSAFQFWGIIQYFVKSQWIYMVHDPLPHIGAETFLYKVHRKFALKRASKFVLFNKAQSDEFCAKYKINEKQIYFNKLSIYDVYTVLQTKNIVNQRKEVLFFGRVDKYKGIEYLCKAIKIVKQSIPTVHLTIAGKGEYSFDIKDFEKLGCISFVNKYISNSEMAEFFNNTTIVVCPYIEATQSGVIMSAYAFGKPVIASNVGGLPEMVEDGKTGMLVEPQNPEALSDAIICLLSNEQICQEMKNNIEQRYRVGDKSWKSIAEKYIEIVKK